MPASTEKEKYEPIYIVELFLPDGTVYTFLSKDIDEIENIDSIPEL